MWHLPALESQNPVPSFETQSPNFFCKIPSLSIYFHTQCIIKYCVSFLLPSKNKLAQSQQLKRANMSFLSCIFHGSGVRHSLPESPAQSSGSCVPDVSQSEFLTEAQNPLASSCWQNSVPCSCRFHGVLLLQGQQERVFIDFIQFCHLDPLKRIH